MRIAITHPTAWPWVRRGSERLLNDLSVFLTQRGHDVTVVTTSPEQGGSDTCNGVRRILLPQRLQALRNFRQVNGFHAFAFDCGKVIRDGGFDAVHCLGYHEAWRIVEQFRGRKGPRVVYQMTGIPVARYFRSVPLDRIMFNRVVRLADEVICLSRFARDCMLRDFSRESLLIPSPTDTAPFMALPRSAPLAPRILFTGDADEPRKGALLLARAFALLRRDDAELHFSGRCSDTTQSRIRACAPPSMQDRIVFHGVGQVEDLPALYASATVAVNPAVWEALGNVLIEALAAGTPVVGCDHGGIPDIIDSPEVGVLFAPRMEGGLATNVEGLADALARGLDLGGRDDTASACRARAEAFGWRKLGLLYEAALCGDSVGATT
jgi:phosphatidylinositol alpha-mannosyltransferase